VPQRNDRSERVAEEGGGERGGREVGNFILGSKEGMEASRRLCRIGARGKEKKKEIGKYVSISVNIRRRRHGRRKGGEDIENSLSAHWRKRGKKKKKGGEGGDCHSTNWCWSMPCFEWEDISKVREGGEKRGGKKKERGVRSSMRWWSFEAARHEEKRKREIDDESLQPLRHGGKEKRRERKGEEGNRSGSLLPVGPLSAAGEGRGGGEQMCLSFSPLGRMISCAGGGGKKEEGKKGGRSLCLGWFFSALSCRLRLGRGGGKRLRRSHRSSAQRLHPIKEGEERERKRREIDWPGLLALWHRRRSGRSSLEGRGGGGDVKRGRMAFIRSRRQGKGKKKKKKRKEGEGEGLVGCAAAPL